MSYAPNLYTVSALAVEFGMDRRRMAKICARIEPAQRKPYNRYFISDVYKQIGHDGPVVEISEIQRRRQHAEMNKAELEAGRMAGSLVDLESHINLLGKVADVVRDRVLGIASKVAPYVALESRQSVCKNIIDDECRKILNEIGRIVRDIPTDSVETSAEVVDNVQSVPPAAEAQRRRVGRPRKGSVA